MARVVKSGELVGEEPEVVIRAFELPLHGIESRDGRDGWQLLRECWCQATALSNWAVQQLMRSEVVRLPGMERIPPYPFDRLVGTKKQNKGRGKGQPGKGLYGMANEVFGFSNQFATDLGLAVSWWEGAAVSAANILKTVQDKYVRERYEVVWLQKRSPTSYKYPHPWPVPAASWKGAGFDEAGRPWVDVSLPGGAVRLRLRGGPEFGRQVALFRQVVKGELPRLQLVIRQQGASPGCHRPVVLDGGKSCRVMVKMVAKLPKPPKRDGRTLVLLTDPQAFWVAELDGRPAWVLNNDHVRRAVEGHPSHLARLQRLSQDFKAERRMGSGRAAGVASRVEKECKKHARFMASWTHETAAHLTGYAVRQGVSEILYLDRDRGFMSKFPWSSLLGKLAQKCEAVGIALYSESGHGEAPAPEGGSGGVDISFTGTEGEKCLRITRLREAAARKVLAGRRRPKSHTAVSVP